MRFVLCPCCKGAGKINPIERPELIAAEAERIRQWCNAHSVEITFDDGIDLKFAARLIRTKLKTLYNWRSNGDGRLKFEKLGGRVVVPIISLAQYILETAEE